MNNKKELYKDLKPFLNCIDYTVSKESYEVMLNEEYDMLVTSPVPSNLETYYLSEEYISHTDSKKGFIDKIYQLVKNYTLKKKLKLINSFNTESKTILDIGAGTGDFLKVCKENNWEIKGVEPSDKARKIAEEKSIRLHEEITEIKNTSFDVITLWHVLEHIPNLVEYTNQLKKLLKPNGVLIIAVPNYKSYDADYYKEFWAAYDVPRHLWHFSKNSIQKIFSNINMNVEKILPMKFDSFYVSLLSEKYKNKKSKAVKAFFVGLKSNLKAKKNGEYSSLMYIIKNK
ncbi:MULTISPECIES: class I SAM-dependent methyltransferase [unclassified Tenacibaculum]|uniref:class I SAM-dependent methyltransferase n=1 Tax=unclassified Tenacibaculum TaxID=2635139 RepID=UPI001F27D193|nr:MULTISPECIES: class I SAM-dependent methyltransferase [unclassified Tenacibaculum]MCF2874826.1 class I SAM-dependent methyltransferase [Tenacibaculum sp. Cn5-1]MCF2934108.1 class I SAM-dependent methyltransferase [Tenacibaculum sp. Cn5-34]MCG7510318.1 class I SAM-dependent methyltransferase [Tenacibaculum sp. Cn5-46]